MGSMKHVDMRKLPAAAQEERRRQVIGRTHPPRAAYRDWYEPVFWSYGRSFERR